MVDAGDSNEGGRGDDDGRGDGREWEAHAGDHRKGGCTSNGLSVKQGRLSVNHGAPWCITIHLMERVGKKLLR